jgi:hypothetical protein
VLRRIELDVLATVERGDTIVELVSKSGGIPDFCVTTVPINVAMQNDLRFFGEMKPPKKIGNARNDMEGYLDSDLDIHAIAVLSDGFDWEIWVRPRNHATEDLNNPYAKASLRETLKTVRTRNMSIDSYRPHEVRPQIDVDGFSAFESDAVMRVIENEFDLESPL